MPVKKTKNINQVVKDYKKVSRGVTGVIGRSALRIYKKNFVVGGFIDLGGVKKWKPRKSGAPRNRGRGVLVSSGRLKRSIKILIRTRSFVRLGTNVEYAEIHNEGGEIKGPQRVRQHKRRSRAGTVSNVAAHVRVANTTIPQRKFIGESRAIILSANRILLRRLRQIL